MDFYKDPRVLRKEIETGSFTYQTSGQCPGYVQGNLVILPRKYAFDFLLFANRNKKACPILEVIESGPILKELAKGQSIAKVLPKYRVYKDGILAEERTDIEELWQEDFVSFVLGCSFTFESALLKAGIPLRHIQEKKNVAMYVTTVSCEKAGLFEGPLVVSMRPIKRDQVEKVVEITSKYPRVHGAPIHIGNPADIGIADIHKPDFGDIVEIKEDEVPVFWACGVTPQAIAMKIKPSLMITHSPGHMLVTDIENESLKGED